MQPAFFTRFARGELARCAIGARLEVDVAQAALAALGEQRALAVLRQIGEQTAVLVLDQRAHRHAQHHVLAAAPVLVGAAAAVTAVRSAELDELLAAKADAAVPAVAGADEDFGLVEEFHGSTTPMEP